MEINGQTIAFAFTLLSLISTLIALVWKFFKWVAKVKKQETEIKRVEKKHENDIREIHQEQEIVIVGLLASLKGLSELGCSESTKDAIKTIETHINKNAHK